MKRTVKEFLRITVEFLYPRRCVLCDRVLGRRDKYVCSDCRKEVRFIRERTCIKCGRVLHSRYETICAECGSGEFEFDECFAPFKYTGKLRDSILNFKYHGRASNAEFYSGCIWKYGGERIRRWNADMIIPVPIHYTRYASRGYNQAFLAAKELSKISGIPVCEEVIIRTRKTEAQKKLGKKDRKENMKRAFSFVYEGKLPKSIIILDDIFTTGSTADAISRILRSHGAENIYVVCVAVS